MGLRGWRVGIIGLCVAAGTVFSVANGIQLVAAAPAPVPTGRLECGIDGRIKISPSLEAGSVRVVKVTATLNWCQGPFDAHGGLTGPRIGSGRLKVTGTGTLDPPGGPIGSAASSCRPAVLAWKPSSAWAIVWHDGPGARGKVLGKTFLSGMTLSVDSVFDGRIDAGTVSAGIQSGGQDWWTTIPASITGGFGAQTSFSIGAPTGNNVSFYQESMCERRGGLQTIFFSGPIGGGAFGQPVVGEPLHPTVVITP